MKSQLSYLIVRLSSLGDILHAVPAVRMLRQSTPRSRIDWLVEQRFRFLVETLPEIDEVYTVDTRTMRQAGAALASWRSTFQTLRQIRKRHYDYALDFQGLFKTALLSAACGAQVRCGFGGALVREKPAHWFYHRRAGASGEPMHVTKLNQAVAALSGAKADTPVGPATLRIPAAERAAAAALLDSMKLRDFVVVNPGGGWPTKRWAPERYGRLAARIIRELGLPVVVTTGPGERPLFERMAEAAQASLHHLSVPFLQLVPLLERALLLVGGDTGPFHLACALERPVVGVYGPTAPVRNGPWQPTEEVVARILPCSFCNGRTCPTRNECMDITVDDVFRAVVRRLARSTRAGSPEAP